MKNIKYTSAGAGSGKTYNLTERIVGLVLDGCKMSELILTTFTKKAAAEFRKKTREKLLERAEKETDAAKKEILLKAATELDSAMIGTVHSVCMQYIRKYWYKLGVSARVTEMDEDAKTEHLSRTLTGSANESDIIFFQKFAQDFGIFEGYGKTKYNYNFWQGYLTEIINKADSFDIKDLDKSEQESLKLAATALSLDGCQIIPHAAGKDDDYYRQSMQECIKRIFSIARKWREEFKIYKEEKALIEFSDMETKFLELLEDKEVCEEIRSSIKYLFVDEFQDSNPKQVKIFDKLSELVQKSFWVGDPKQSIYKFRGSDIELVHAVINDSSVTKSEPLKESWRSEKHLVYTANTVFEPLFNEILEKDEITLSPHRTESLPDCAKSLHVWDLRKFFDPELGKMKAGKPYLIRAVAAQVADMVNGRHEISKVIDKETGKERKIQASDIAILTRSGMDDGKDGAEYVKALTPWGIPIVHEDKISPSCYELQTVSLILNYFITDNSSLLNAELCRLLFDMSTEEILRKNPEGLRALTACLASIKKDVGNGSIAGMVRSIILRLNLLDRCGKWGCKEDRRRNLICLMKAAEDYDSNCLDSGQSATVEGFLSEIAEGVVVPEGFSPGGVTVCTYHKSKGLEWGAVVLTGLSSDNTSDAAIMKHYVTGTKIVRVSAPTKDNIYSDYYITSVPAYSDADIKGRAAAAIMDTAEYRDFKEQEIAEAQRLFYVGFTRARDYLIAATNRDNWGPYSKMRWFKAIGLPDDGIDPKWPDGSLQVVWGPGTEPCNFRKIDVRDAPERIEAKTYHCIPDTEPDKTTDEKRIAPSELWDDALVGKTALKFLNLAEGEELEQTVKTVRPYEKETTIGTCIHNIFAVFNPDAPHSEMVALAERTISNFSLEENLPDAEALICSIENLYDFLGKNYGPAVKTEREIPFREIRDGQTCVGSIDFVWYTSDKECVLVDYKNLSRATKAVIDPESDEYIGHYIPQQKAYKDALERAGFKVKASLLHLSLQEKVVEIKF